MVFAFKNCTLQTSAEAAFPCTLHYLSDGICPSDQTLFNVGVSICADFSTEKIIVQTKSACRSDFPYFPQVSCVKIIIIKKMRFKTETYEKLIGLVREETALYDDSLSG